MSKIRILNALVMFVCLLGAVYYTAAEKELQGVIVVLLGILYFVGLPRIVEDDRL